MFHRFNLPIDAQKTVQDLNRIMAEGRNSRKARKESEQTAKQLQEEGGFARLKSERAFEAACNAHPLVVQEAQHKTEKAENASAQIMAGQTENAQVQLAAAEAKQGTARDVAEARKDAQAAAEIERKSKEEDDNMGGGGGTPPNPWNAFQQANKGKYSRAEMSAAYWMQKGA